VKLLDKRLIIGILAIVIIVGGLYVFVLNKPASPPVDGDGGDGGNGGEPPNQQAIIEGVITDDTGEPVSDATVTLDGKTATTAVDGSYSFTADVNTYTVTVSKDGYESTSSTVSALNADNYTVDLTITETVIEPTAVELKIITRHGSDILFKARAAFLETDIAAQYGISNRDQIKFLKI
jgi:hypothetical protein